MSFVVCQNEQKKKRKEKLIHSGLKIDDRRGLLQHRRRHSPAEKNKRHHLMDEQALNYEVRKIISSSPTMKLLKDIQRAVVIHRGTSAPL